MTQGAAQKSRTAKEPRYRQLANELIDEIRSGRLAVGEVMPGELELVETHGVSRHTVRESLRVLEDLGLIGRYQGVGTVVKSRESTPAYVQTVGTPAELLQYPADSRLSAMESEDVRAGRALARLLGCRTGTEWVRIGAVRRIQDSGLPICWVDIYVRPEYRGVAEKIGRSRQPVYEIIEQQFDEAVDSVAIDIRAGVVSAPIADALGVEAGTPSLRVIRRYRGKDGKHFEVSVSEHPAERFTYSLELKRGWESGSGWSAS